MNKKKQSKHLMMELNYFIDSWNRITIHQIVHLLNNITVSQRICKCDSAVNKTIVTPLCHSSDNIQVLKAVIHEQRMESNADGQWLLNALLTLADAIIW